MTKLASACLLVVVGVSLVGSASAADVKIAPAPPWYRPMRCGLQEAPAKPLSAEPKYLGKPLYGSITLGDAEDNAYTVVVDLAADWEAFKEAYKTAEGKVDMATVPARIYLDGNHDGNLTNDGPGVVARCNDSPQTPGSFTIQTTGKCLVRYADRARIRYPISVYMFPQRPKVKQRDGSELDYSRTLFYYRTGSFETRLPIGDKKVLVRFYDENTDGLIVTEDKDQFAIDLNQDRVFDPNMKGPELYALDAPFNFGGESYVLKTFGPRGNRPTAAVSEKKVEPPVYIIKGKPAPDFAMPTLDGGTFKLSDQQGKVVVIDFWATWCGPCRAELPNVVKMWEDLKDKGLVLVGISMDFDDKDGKAIDKVSKFAAEQKMTWTHVVEGKYWDSEVGKLYQVSGIPHTVLVGSDGNILALGLRGTELHDAAKQALEKG
ncbi:MAG: TlpA family protein disulfide reductase [Armatimonadetes bacterium]|nr:TlpA family protein disulfide reductase [Armatimonadota bacterium]